ncbi:MAG: cystathionine gamma-synthase [Propionibacteriaceae bacterium]|jgi:cystathionine gamma-synthase|nr:cystathionine gamma-synthase [Propionibacteriaceae bacterium]
MSTPETIRQPEPQPATVATRAGLATDPAYRAVVPPIYLSTNYAFDDIDQRGPFDYSRSNNPTRQILSEALAQLEFGQGAEITSSGLGAITACLHSLTRPGDLVLAPHDCYGGTWRLLDALARRGVIRLELADFTDPGLTESIERLRPALVWVETPSNPLLRITDIAAVAEASHAVGAQVVADNTFLSPALQNPLRLGADVVVHSTTKYINGHSDVIGGLVVAGQAERAEDLRWWCNALGLTASAFDCYLVLRGLRTLFPRVRAHCDNAAHVVAAIAGHPALTALHYPGLADHPGHALAARQQHGFGAMISFDVGSEAAARRFLGGLRHFSLAESLGGVESLVCHPGRMTHAAMPPQVQAAAGLTPGLLRLSVGVEQAEDLAADLLAGLDRALA